MNNEFSFVSKEFIIYAGLTGVSLILVVWRSLWFILLCMKACINLHNKMFSSVMKSTMRFFYINPLGRILNRFSKDVGVMDEILPKTMLEAVQVIKIGIIYD